MTLRSNDSSIQLPVLRVEQKRGDLQGANSVISDALKNIDIAPINIAVTGVSGAGKSSLINALREVKDEGEGAAEVGVAESTMKTDSYEQPQN